MREPLFTAAGKSPELPREKVQAMGKTITTQSVENMELAGAIQFLATLENYTANEQPGNDFSWLKARIIHAAGLSDAEENTQEQNISSLLRITKLGADPIQALEEWNQICARYKKEYLDTDPFPFFRFCELCAASVAVTKAMNHCSCSSQSIREQALERDFQTPFRTEQYIKAAWSLYREVLGYIPRPPFYLSTTLPEFFGLNTSRAIHDSTDLNDKIDDSRVSIYDHLKPKGKYLLP